MGKFFLSVLLSFSFIAEAHPKDPLILTALPIKGQNTALTGQVMDELNLILSKQAKINIVLTTRQSASLQGALKKAQEAMLNFNDGEAMRIINSALSDFPRQDHGIENQSRLVEAHLLLASCYKNTGETRRLMDELDETARLNPSYQPTELLFPPSLINLFEAAKDRLWKKGEFGHVTIETPSTRASVYLNGFYKGATPLRLDKLPIGKHHLMAMGDMMEDYREISIIKGDNPTVKMRLHQTTPGASVEGETHGPSDSRALMRWLKIIAKTHQASRALGVAAYLKDDHIIFIIHSIGLSKLKENIITVDPRTSPKNVAARIASSLSLD